MSHIALGQLGNFTAMHGDRGATAWSVPWKMPPHPGRLDGRTVVIGVARIALIVGLVADALGAVSALVLAIVITSGAVVVLGLGWGRPATTWPMCPWSLPGLVLPTSPWSFL